MVLATNLKLLVPSEVLCQLDAAQTVTLSGLHHRTDYGILQVKLEISRIKENICINLLLPQMSTLLNNTSWLMSVISHGTTSTTLNETEHSIKDSFAILKEESLNRNVKFSTESKKEVLTDASTIQSEKPVSKTDAVQTTINEYTNSNINQRRSRRRPNPRSILKKNYLNVRKSPLKKAVKEEDHVETDSDIDGVMSEEVKCVDTLQLSCRDKKPKVQSVGYVPCTNPVTVQPTGSVPSTNPVTDSQVVFNTTTTSSSRYCRCCKQKFRNAAERRIHQFYKCSKNPNKSEEEHICVECSKPCETRNQLMGHMARAHQMEGIFSCPTCKGEFKSRSSLRYHTLKTHREAESKPTCKQCGKQFTSMTGLNRHETSCGTQTTQSMCSQCGKIFKNQKAVNTHITYFHRMTWPFHCDTCGRHFKLERKLDNHVCKLTCHTGDPDVGQDNKHTEQCSLCDIKKMRKYALYKHLLEVHKDHPQYDEELQRVKKLLKVQCDGCGKDFSTITALYKHKRSNCNKPQDKAGYPCPFCTKISASITMLHRHITTIHHEHPQFSAEEEKLRVFLTVQCEYCGNWYPDKSTCRSHYLQAHNPHLLRCQYCSAAFRLQTQLNQHINRRHLGIPTQNPRRPPLRICKLCRRSFTTRRGLERHMDAAHKDHSIKKYECDKCPFMYRTSRQYYAHHRRYHSGISHSCIGCKEIFPSRYFLKRHIDNCSAAQELKNAKNEKAAVLLKQKMLAESMDCEDDEPVDHSEYVVSPSDFCEVVTMNTCSSVGTGIIGNDITDEILPVNTFGTENISSDNSQIIEVHDENGEKVQVIYVPEGTTVDLTHFQIGGVTGD